MKRQMKNKQKGFTFIELLGGLIVIALGYAVIAGVAQGVAQNGRISQATMEIHQIKAAANMYAAPGDFENMTFEKLNVGPRLGNGENSNPWGGDYDITPVDTPFTNYELVISDVADEAIDPMIALLDIGASTAAVNTAGTITVSYAK